MSDVEQGEYFLTTSRAAVRSSRHPGTIRRALEAGELHGVQRVKGGVWLIEPACLDAYVAGQLCEHRQPVAGNVVQFRKRVG